MSVYWEMERPAHLFLRKIVTKLLIKNFELHCDYNAEWLQQFFLAKWLQ